MKLTCLLALLLVCGTAQASEWVLISRPADGVDEILVDVSSIEVKGAIRRALVKMTFAPETHSGTGGNANRWLSESTDRFAFNCDEETHRLEGSTAHFSDGTVHVESPAGYPTRWKRVTPGTVASGVIKFICAWKPR